MMGEVSEGFGEDRDWVGLTLPVRWTGFTDRSGIADYELSLGTVLEAIILNHGSVWVPIHRTYSIS